MHNACLVYFLQADGFYFNEKSIRESQDELGLLQECKQQRGHRPTDEIGGGGGIIVSTPCTILLKIPFRRQYY